MKQLLGIALLCLMVGQVMAQDVLLTQDVEKDTIVEDWGPNRKAFDYTYLHFGFIVGDGDSAGIETRLGHSYEWGFGWRHKTRINNLYSIGYGFAVTNRVYNIKQDSGKVFPNTVLHEKERFSNWNLNVQLYNRFNIGRRGNVVGNYIDLGVYGEWAFSNRHKVYNDLGSNNSANAGAEKTVYRDLDYPSPIKYGVEGRIGFGKLVFYGRYRISDLFQSDFKQYPDPSRIVAGIEMGIF